MKTLVAAQVPAAEPEFLLAVQRAMRAPRDRLAILVHLSRLREARASLPPAHQLHLARSILQDAAQRFEGQVFTLRNGDLALLCRGAGAPAEAPQAMAIEPAALPGILARLFHADMARLVSVWPLTTEGDALLGYAADRLAELPVNSPVAPNRPPATGNAILLGQPTRPRVVAGAEPSALDVIEGIAALLAGSRVAELMHGQNGLRLRPSDLPWPADADGEGPPVMGDGTLTAAFRELSFSIEALEARVATLGGRGLARTDPFLFRHLAARLDARMLGALLSEIGRGGPLDPSGGVEGQPALHLNLTLPTILSDGFTRLVEACRDRPGGLGVEIAYVEACADPARFRRARMILAQAGVTLVLDGVGDAALRLTRPWRLLPDLLKLEWSPRLATEDPDIAAEIAGMLDMVGPQAVVLYRAETAAALAWGMARGIELFQGREVDAMLGARRIGRCPLAAGCTTQQCIERAASVGSGRSGCGNLRLLDAGRLARPEMAASGSAEVGSAEAGSAEAGSP